MRRPLLQQRLNEHRCAQGWTTVISKFGVRF